MPATTEQEARLTRGFVDKVFTGRNETAHVDTIELAAGAAAAYAFAESVLAMPAFTAILGAGRLNDAQRLRLVAQAFEELAERL